jgi:hypothetical protein
MPHSKMPEFHSPVSVGDDPIVSISHWDVAYDEFEAKNYKASLIGLLNFINPNLLKNVDTNIDIKITKPHGSALVKISITDDKFRLVAPFLKIDKSNKVALMRRVSEVNFNPLNLVQIFLKDDVLWFEFNTDLELCQPNKIYEAIRELCKYCDDYDDEFIEKYKATFFHKPKITALSEEDKEKVWSHFQETGEQYRSYLSYFEQKRWHSSIWDVLAISIFNLANLSCINGSLRTDLDEALFHLYDGNIDGNYRLDRGKKYLNKLFDETTKEDFLSNVYEADKLISLKLRSSNQILQNEFEHHKERIHNSMSEGKYFDSAYVMYVMFLKVLYEYNLDEGHRAVIVHALEKASGVETEKAVDVLKAVYVDFLNGAVESSARMKPKGFFAKLFG